MNDPAPIINRFFGGLVCVLMALGGVSCGPGPLEDDWVTQRPLANTDPTYRPPSLRSIEPDWSGSPNDAPATDDVVTLHDVVRLALQHSPKLRDRGWHVRGQEASTLQASLSPNPLLRYSIENLDGPEGGDLFVRQTVRVSQVLEIGGKRTKRVQLARAEQRLAAWDFEATRIQVATDAAKRFIDAIVARQYVEHADRTLGLAEQTYQIVQQRVNAGIVPRVELDKAKVRVSSERVFANRTRSQLRTAYQKLAAVWGGLDVSFSKVEGDLETMVRIPEESGLIPLLAANPRIAKKRDELDVCRKAWDLAKANSIPNVTVGAGVRHFPDARDVAGVVDLAIPLPISDRRQGDMLKARYRFMQTQAALANEQSMLRSNLTAAYDQLIAAEFEIRTLLDEALPAARSAFGAAKDSFTQGRTDYLTVLDAERTLTTVERQLIDARGVYHSAVADIEQITATPIDHGDRSASDESVSP